MRELPRGTVTFLFTDIEGSTRLLRELGDRYAEMLAEHRRVLRAAVDRHGGVVVDTQGDALFAAFSRAAAAVNAAAEAQRGLEGLVRVRMGLHSGETSPTGDGYVGLDVHKGARICAAAHGGQVLLSTATARLSRAKLRDLGLHRLRDLGEPEQLFQLGDAEFPTLRTLNATNLPVQATALVGRERELAEGAVLLREHRLLTLVGPGGTGKTRLALQLAADAVDSFPHGVFWVSLASIREPELVLPAIARTIGAQNGIAEHVADKRMLLLLDNVEQVISCAPELAEILSLTPNVKLLVTSREPLRVTGEREYEVEPLAEADAVTLFVERARVDRSDAVRDICRRLEGLPLAIELAAARVKVIAPEQLLARLEHALPVLIRGARDAPERQRTLRATIEWSYELLEPRERELLARLAVFAGGWTLDAAEAICGADIDLLHSLADKSLVRVRNARFSMLETIGEFARERLSPEETRKLVDLHADYYLRFAEGCAADVWDRAHVGFAPDHANVRVALVHVLAGRDATRALRFVVALIGFWLLHGYVAEGLRAAERALQTASEGSELRTRVLRIAAALAFHAEDNGRAKALAAQADDEFLSLGTGQTPPNQLGLRASIAVQEGDPRAAALAREHLAFVSETGNSEWLAGTLRGVGDILRDCGELDEAQALFERSIELSTTLGLSSTLTNATHGLGDLAVDQADADSAVARYVESLLLARELGFAGQMGYCLAGLAAAAALQGREERAGVLWGAVEAYEREVGGRLLPQDRARYERVLVRPRDTGAFEESVTRGRAMSFDDAVTYALSDVD